MEKHWIVNLLETVDRLYRENGGIIEKNKGGHIITQPLTFSELTPDSESGKLDLTEPLES